MHIDAIDNVSIVKNLHIPSEITTDIIDECA